MTPVDLSLACDGYLRSADGRLRRIEGLDRIAARTVREGVRIVWGATPGGGAGVAGVWSRVVVLAPWLFDEEGFVIRDVWSHEVAHCVVGQSHARACRWQVHQFGDLLAAAEV